MDKVKYRNMFVQILLFLITFGLYGFFWFYSSCDELKTVANDENAKPVLWTVLIFVPFGVFYSYFKYAELYEKVCTEKINKWVIYLLILVIGPVVWFLVQKDLNRIATTKDF